MINTIFYFPESLTFEEYTNKLAANEIADKTIVFAKAQKSIYMGGECYTGTNSDDQSDTPKVNPDSMTVYYGFGPESLTNVNELNHIEKQSPAGTYNVTNDKDYSAYLWFVFPKAWNVRSITMTGGMIVEIPTNKENPTQITVDSVQYNAIRSEEGDFENGSFTFEIK